MDSAVVHRAWNILWSAILAFAILAFGSGCWSLLLGLNSKTRRAFPWSVPVMAAILWLMWQYLRGRWWPRGTAEARRRLLRANPVRGQVLGWAFLSGVLATVALAGCWIVLFQLVRTPPSALPNMAGYPHPTVLVVLLMASLVAPFTEEAAFRGYCLTVLERGFSVPAAAAISSIFFALAHLTFGLYWTKLAVYFLVGIVLAAIALLANSIWASIPVHVVSDLVFFTMVWPHDAGRRIVAEGGADARFRLHVAQVMLFSILSVLAFRHLARITAPSRASTGNLDSH